MTRIPLFRSFVVVLPLAIGCVTPETPDSGATPADEGPQIQADWWSDPGSILPEAEPEEARPTSELDVVSELDRVIGPSDLAVLGVGDDMRLEIVLMDQTGEVTAVIPTPLTDTWEANFAWSEAGYFLVLSGGSITRVYLNGDVDDFGQPDGDYVWRVSADPDGDVTVAEEEEMAEYDEDGDVILAVTDWDACYMDVDVTEDGSVLAVDTYGPSVVTWNRENNVVSTVFGYTPLSWGLDVIGRDLSDTVWVGESYGARLHVGEGATGARVVGTLTELGQDADVLLAVEGAGDHSVFVLYDGWQGSGIVTVTADGDLAPVAQAGDNLWLDLVRLN